MADRTKTVDIPLNYGLLQQIDSKLMPNGKLKRAENIRIRKGGRIGKRTGSRALFSSGSFSGELEGAYAETSDAKLFLRGGELQKIDASSRRILGNVPRWQLYDYRFTASNDRNGPASIASTCVNGLHVTAYYDLDAGNAFVQVIVRDLATQAIVSSQRAVTIALTGTGVRVVPLSTTQVAILWYDATDIWHRILDTTTLSLAAAVSVGAHGGFNFFDAAEFNTATPKYVLLYQSGAAQLTLASVNAAGVIATTTIATGASSLRPCVYVGASKIFSAWFEFTGSNMRVMTHDLALGSPTAITTVESSASNSGRPVVGPGGSQGDAVFVWSRAPTATVPPLLKYCTVSNAAAAGSIQQVYGIRQASKPFLSASNYPALMAASGESGEVQAQFHLIELFSSSVAGVLLPQLSLAPNQANGVHTSMSESQITKVGTNQFIWAPAVLTAGTIGDGSVGAYFVRMIHDAEPLTNKRPGALANGALFIGGGALQYQSSASPVEQGFAWYPKIKALTQAGGGSLTALGTYSYVATYEWTDGQGRLHRSEPSAPVSVTLTGANSQVTASVTQLALTARGVGINGADVLSTGAIRLYRTLNNGTIYYLVPPLDLPAAAGSSGTGNLVDGNSDASISDNAILYTQGGILANSTPPPARLVAASRTRLWLAGLPDENVVQCSKLITPSEPIAFADHDAFRAALPARVTAIAALDDALIAFTETEVYAILGDGPDDTGTGVFSEPRRIPSSVGCIDARSLLEIPGGLIFQSRRGLHLLPRGLSAPVLLDSPTDLLETYPVVTSATLVSDSTEQTARWTLTNNAGNAGGVLVLDLRSEQFSFDTYQTLFLAQQVYDGVWHGFENGTTDAVKYEAGFGDGSSGTSFVSSLLELGDIRPFGLQGRGLVRRINVLGEFRGECSIKVEASYDGGVTYPDSKTWALTNASGLVAGDQVRREWQLPRIKLDQVRFRLSDVNISGASEGFVFNAIVIHTERQPGIRRAVPGDR